MAEKPQLTEDEEDQEPEIVPTKRCLGLGCNEKVPLGSYFCQKCLNKKNATRVGRVPKNNNGIRVCRAPNLNRDC